MKLCFQVWISYAQFEMANADSDNVLPARRVFERANQSLKMAAGEKEERVMLLEAWRDFEKQNGDEESLKVVEDKMPRRIKKRRKMVSEDGVCSFLCFTYFLFLFIFFVLFFQWIIFIKIHSVDHKRSIVNYSFVAPYFIMNETLIFSR